MGGRYTFPWIVPLYPWYIPYIADCYARRYQVPFLKSLVWRDLGLNPVLPDHWRTLYPLVQLKIKISSSNPSNLRLRTNKKYQPSNLTTINKVRPRQDRHIREHLNNDIKLHFVANFARIISYRFHTNLLYILFRQPCLLVSSPCVDSFECHCIRRSVRKAVISPLFSTYSTFDRNESLLQITFLFSLWTENVAG